MGLYLVPAISHLKPLIFIVRVYPGWAFVSDSLGGFLPKLGCLAQATVVAVANNQVV